MRAHVLKRETGDAGGDELGCVHPPPHPAHERWPVVRVLAQHARVLGLGEEVAERDLEAHDPDQRRRDLGGEEVSAADEAEGHACDDGAHARDEHPGYLVVPTERDEIGDEPEDRLHRPRRRRDGEEHVEARRIDHELLQRELEADEDKPVAATARCKPFQNMLHDPKR